MKTIAITIITVAFIALTAVVNAHATLTFYYEEDGNACNRYVEQWEPEIEQSDLTDRIDFMASHTEDHESKLLSVTTQVAFIPDHDLVNATVKMHVYMYAMEEIDPARDIDEHHTITKNNVNALAGELVVFTLGKSLVTVGNPEPSSTFRIYRNITFWTEIETAASGHDQVITMGINESTNLINVGDCGQN